jgi:sugar phosphate isomerase/epimerase
MYEGEDLVMSVGVLAHLFGRLPVHQLAAQVAERGFTHVQLALWKAIDGIDFTRPGKLSPGLAMHIGETFARQGVAISVLGCYIRLFERDPEQRRINTERFKELLRHARYFGCPVVAAETGHYPDGHTEEDWKTMRQVLEELVEEAERWGVYVGLEAANGHLIGTAQELRRMLDEVPSSMIGIVIDPGNLLNESNFDRQDEVIEEAFRLLGERVVTAHAKDRIRAADGRIVTVPAGQGAMNYGLYMKLLNAYKPHAHIIMEEAPPEEMRDTKRFIESIRENTALL